MKLIFTTDTLDRGGKERQLTLLFSALPAGIERQIWTKNYNPEAGYLQEYATDLNAIKTYKEKLELRAKPTEVSTEGSKGF